MTAAAPAGAAANQVWSGGAAGTKVPGRPSTYQSLPRTPPSFGTSAWFSVSGEMLGLTLRTLPSTSSTCNPDAPNVASRVGSHWFCDGLTWIDETARSPVRNG